MSDLDVAVADPALFPQIGAVTVAGYAEFLDGDDHDDYIAELAAVERRAEACDILVVTGGAEGCDVLGAVAYVHKGGPYEDIAFGADEAEFRMLVVAPTARGRGVGPALVGACVERAATQGRARLVISTMVAMTTAHRMYERLGFVRVPARDWAPLPSVPLLAYALEVNGLPYCDRCGEPVAAGGHERCISGADLEPPRWCPRCRRRMVVQVTPGGWSAQCSAHGLTESR